jgi:cytoskeletal protein CcmA (bactofilin family)
MLGRGRLNRLHKPERTTQSIFGETMAITGDLDSGDPIQIDGVVEGDVRGTLVTVTRQAAVKGSIYADAVRVAGSVTGLIKAATVILTRTARLSGSIDCENLAIEPGADVTMHCRAGKPDDGETILLPSPAPVAEG